MKAKLVVGMTAAFLLSGCGGSDSVSQPTAQATNDPVDAKGCLVHYGDPPRPMTHTVNGLLATQNLCAPLGGELLTDFTDSSGTPRQACLVTPAGASKDKPLPLLVWVHPSLFPMDTVHVTNIPEAMTTADLSGDPARPGFILLLPAGRDTEHYYPSVDASGLGWDNWYRNLDRSRADLNVDVAALDHFIAEARGRGNVDEKRVFMSGWSNGSAMTVLYALNTPGIAAAAVYSAPDPFGAFDDPCPQAPFASQPTPIYHVHNDCDIFGICPGGAKLFETLRTGLSPASQDQIIDTAMQAATMCNALCDPNQPLGETLGSANHLRWPLLWTDTMFQYLRDHPLP